jgi:enoyl-CoA hydratase/long-chain 3-hydroxyacyl-CoA dehydrogenase
MNSSNIVSLTDQTESWRKHFSKADMVIEAVFEEIGLKRKIVRLCEESTPEHCVFCTNTSAIPIKSIAEGSLRPHSIIGMHYFRFVFSFWGIPFLFMVFRH